MAIFNFVFYEPYAIETKRKIATDNNLFIFYGNYLRNDIYFILNAKALPDPVTYPSGGGAGGDETCA